MYPDDVTFIFHIVNVKRSGDLYAYDPLNDFIFHIVNVKRKYHRY